MVVLAMVPPPVTFHSGKPGTAAVFHNNGECSAGRLIEAVFLRAGDGGRLLCAQCIRLNAASQIRTLKHRNGAHD